MPGSLELVRLIYLEESFAGAFRVVLPRSVRPSGEPPARPLGEAVPAIDLLVIGDINPDVMVTSRAS